MLKPANKSLEGQSTAAVLVSCVGAIYYVLGDDKSISPETVATMTKSAQEFISVMSTTHGSDDLLVQLKELGKLGMILAFMYKVYISFLNSRTELKKEELKLRLQQSNNTDI